MDSLIVSAGYNISAAELETVLSGHGSVAEVAVVGVPDPVRGTVPAAFVAWTRGTVPGEPAVTALRDHARAELASYKCPRHYVEMDALPRLPSGTVDDAALRRLFRPLD